MHILNEDPWLLEGIAPTQRLQAVREIEARVLQIPRGQWAGIEQDALPGGIGLLVLRGLLLRRVGVEGRFGGELLGEGDLLRPWQGEGEAAGLRLVTGWRVLQPSEVAVLDRRCAHRMARYPELIGRLVGRAIERSRNLSINMAIVHHARIEIRLQMLFWHLADRWGRVRADGVIVPLRLTHAVIADLVAARRPTVSGALSDLARRGLVTAEADGWLLHGDPPGELLELQEVEVAPDAPTPPPPDRRA